MDCKISIISEIAISEYIDALIAKGHEDLDNREASISFYEQDYIQIAKHLQTKLQGFPCDIALKFTGSPERWNIEISSCDWWRRPLLWWKLRQYKRKLGKGPLWDMMRGEWVDKDGKPLSERRIKRLGLDPDPTNDIS